MVHENLAWSEGEKVRGEEATRRGEVRRGTRTEGRREKKSYRSSGAARDVFFFFPLGAFRWGLVFVGSLLVSSPPHPMLRGLGVRSPCSSVISGRTLTLILLAAGLLSC